MKTITCFADLAAYGIEPLTGEACGLGYRILCDVTEKGRNVLSKAFGIPTLVLAENWNRGSPQDPHVGCVMLAHEMLTSLAIFALLESGCKEVWLVRDGGVIGIELEDLPDMIDANRRLIGERLVRTLAYRGTAGDRNVHMMSGRIE
jgi:hypothetical protein